MKSVVNILPTIKKDDVLFLFKHLLRPKKVWSERVITELEYYFPDAMVLLFDSGRSALSFVAQHVVKHNSALYTQAFTCSAVVYPFLQSNTIPLYIDIDQNTFNINYEDLLKKHNNHARAILLQYTFGLVPRKLEKILSYAKKHKLCIIEDLAHSFGNTYHNKYLGNFGDYAVLSFGRDKVISSVSGGALIVRNPHWRAKLREEYQKLTPPTPLTQWKLVFYLIFMSWTKHLYHLRVTRLLIFLLQQIRLLDKSVSHTEKQGQPAKKNTMHSFAPLMLPLLYHQLLKLNTLTKQRKQQTKEYNKQYEKQYRGALLKYPLLVPKPQSIVKQNRRQHLYLDRWYHNIIDPKGVSFKAYRYTPSSCPTAEAVARSIINLPTLQSVQPILDGNQRS